MITSNDCSGGFRGDLRGSPEPPLDPNYFIFMGKFGKNLVKWQKRTPLVTLNTPSKIPGLSEPAQELEKRQSHNFTYIQTLVAYIGCYTGSTFKISDRISLFSWGCFSL